MLTKHRRPGAGADGAAGGHAAGKRRRRTVEPRPRCDSFGAQARMARALGRFYYALMSVKFAPRFGRHRPALAEFGTSFGPTRRKLAKIGPNLVQIGRHMTKFGRATCGRRSKRRDRRVTRSTVRKSPACPGLARFARPGAACRRTACSRHTRGPSIPPRLRLDTRELHNLSDGGLAHCRAQGCVQKTGPTTS